MSNIILYPIINILGQKIFNIATPAEYPDGKSFFNPFSALAKARGYKHGTIPQELKKVLGKDGYLEIRVRLVAEY